MLSSIICILTIKQVGVCMVVTGIFFIAGALGMYLLEEDDRKAGPNKAEEKLRAKILAEKGEDHV